MRSTSTRSTSDSSQAGAPLSHIYSQHPASALSQNEQNEPASVDRPPLNYGEYSILLVDDTPNNLDILIGFLQEYGFGLRIARSGESAIQRIQYDAPSIILLDVLLPGIDGFETCRQLKADPATSEIPIIFMTSLANVEDKVRGFEVGAVDYVTKPLQQAEVLARLTTHLRQQSLTQNLQEQNRQLIRSNQVERERLLDAVAQQRYQLRTLASKLTEVQEGERQRLSRELHDELGQALTAVRINLATIEKDLPPDATVRIHERLTEAVQLVDMTLEQVRELALDLRPSMLDDLGLVSALRWYIGRFAKRMNIRVDFDDRAFPHHFRLSASIETALYRVVQEALTNVARHAQASQVQVSLAIEDADLSATIEDNGCGFDVGITSGASEPSPYASGIGLVGMRERVLLIGGSCQIDSVLDKGTRIQLRVPLE